MLPELSDQSMFRFHEQISQPAADLEASIRLSSTKYRFTNFPTLEPPEFARIKYGSVGPILHDIKRRKNVKCDGHLGSNSHGHIGRPLLRLEPALLRQDNGRGTLLRNTKLLFEFYTELPKRR